MASLTQDQKAIIGVSPTFHQRVGQVLRDKGQFWNGFATPNRSDVNQRTQKRKKLAKRILNTNFAEDNKVLVGQFWLTTYSNDPAILDGEGIPTATVINDNFDPTYDYFAEVVAGDENETEIAW